MGFWSKLGKIGGIAGAGLATAFTGGAASPLLGMAIGAGIGAGTGALSGGGWKGALIGAGLGGATGGIGSALGGAGGAASGWGALPGSFNPTGALAGASKGGWGLVGRLAPSAIKGTTAALQGAGDASGGGGGPGYTMPTVAFRDPSTLGYLNPLGMQAKRRTDMAGMGVRDYA